MGSTEDCDREVRDALAQALGEKKIRIATKVQRRRMLALYIIGLLVLAYVATLSVTAHRAADAATHAQVVSDHDRARFERISIINCQATRANAVKFNSLIDRLVKSYKTSPALTPEQRAQRALFFSDAKYAVPRCPPLSSTP